MSLFSRAPTGSLVRGGGVAVACLVPGVVRRAEVVATTYAAAWPIDRPGLQLVTVVPDEEEEAWRRALVPVASSGASWTVAMSLAALAVRRLRLPLPVGAALLGVGVVAADSLLAGWAEARRAKAVAVAGRAQATPATEPAPG